MCAMKATQRRRYTGSNRMVPI